MVDTGLHIFLVEVIPQSIRTNNDDISSHQLVNVHNAVLWVVSLISDLVRFVKFLLLLLANIFLDVAAHGRLAIKTVEGVANVGATDDSSQGFQSHDCNRGGSCLIVHPDRVSQQPLGVIRIECLVAVKHVSDDFTQFSGIDSTVDTHVGPSTNTICHDNKVWLNHKCILTSPVCLLRLGDVVTACLEPVFHRLHRIKHS